MLLRNYWDHYFLTLNSHLQAQFRRKILFQIYTATALETPCGEFEEPFTDTQEIMHMHKTLRFILTTNRNIRKKHEHFLMKPSSLESHLGHLGDRIFKKQKTSLTLPPTLITKFPDGKSAGVQSAATVAVEKAS